MTLLMREREKYKEEEMKGAVQACKNFNLSFQETVQYLIDNFNLSSYKAEDDVNRYWS